MCVRWDMCDVCEVGRVRYDMCDVCEVGHV